MTTLIAVYNSEGCVGRCDARCYEAKSAKCHCICGGKNHSAGLRQAVANTEAGAGLADGDLDHFMRRQIAKGKGGEMVVVNRVDEPDAKKARHFAYMKINQPSLFAMLNQPGPIGIDRTPMSWWKNPA